MVLEEPERGRGAWPPRARFARALLVVAIFCAALLPASGDAAVPANGRAWELVTPGEVVSRIATAAPPAANGASLIFVSFGPLPGAKAGALVNLGRAVRGPGGWLSSPIGFPYTPVEKGDLFELLLPFVPAGPESDPYSLVLSVIPLSAEPFEKEHFVLYRRQAPGNGLTQVAVLEEDTRTLFNFKSGGGFLEAIDDDGRAAFASTEHLRPSDAGRTEGSSLYESAGSTLTQIDVGADGNSVSPCGSVASHHNGISRNGSRVFFTSPPSSSSCGEPSEVYLREGGATTRVSASQCTRPDCGPASDVAFAGATPDGRFAFLATARQLTNDDRDSLRDLYRYDVSNGELALLSGGDPAATGEQYGPLAFPSDDGAYVYFYGMGQLALGERGEGIGLFLAGPDGLRFVAPARLTYENPPAEETVQLARDGEVALFEGAPEGRADGDNDSSTDAYLYDAVADKITRLSQGPVGGNGEFDATIAARVEQSPVPGRPLFYRSLSADGRVAFFITDEALVPEDVNESTDVYEWRRGAVGLVSSGTGSDDNEVGFLGASSDGSTAFFITGETLLPRDRDGGEDDVYAARVGGGFAEGPSAPGCEALDCPPALTARLSRPTPPSAGPLGGGKRIRLLKVLRRGRAGSKRGVRFELRVNVPAAGRVSVAGTRLGSGGERVVEGARSVSKAGGASIPLRLSGSLARTLDEGDPVRVRLAIRQAKWRLVRIVTLAGGHR